MHQLSAILELLGINPAPNSLHLA